MLGVTLVGRVDLFDVVLGVFYDNLVRVAVKVEHHRDHVLLPIFNPPRLKAKALNLIFLDE